MSTDSALWGFAVLGTTLFVMQAVLMFTGVLGDGAGPHDVDTSSGSVGDFQLLSFQSLTAFFMTFGWSGLAALNEFNLATPYALLVGLGIGLLCMGLTSWMFQSIRKLATEGAVYRLEDLVGIKTSVYETIPVGGVGRIQATVGSMIREVKAVAEDRQAIESFAHVEVLKVVDSETVSVQRVRQ